MYRLKLKPLSLNCIHNYLYFFYLTQSNVGLYGFIFVRVEIIILDSS